MGLVFCVAVACSSALVLAQKPNNASAPSPPDVRWLSDGSQAWMVQPAKHRLAGVVQAFAAPDGAALMALVSEPSPRLVLLAQDGAVLASAPASEGEQVKEVHWAEDGSLAAIRLSQGEGMRLLLMSSAGRSAEAPSGLNSIISGGPGILLAVQIREGGSAKDFSGAVGLAAAANGLRFAPSEAYTSLLQAGWRPVSQLEGFLARDKEAMRINIRTGEATALSLDKGQQESWSLSLRPGEGGDKTAWLSAGRRSDPLALSRDAVWVSLAKNNRQALYISDGSLFARRIQPAPMEQMRAAQAAEARRQAEEDAREAIQAVWAIAGRNGNQLPDGSSQALIDALEELGLGDRVRFNNLGGQNIKSGENPEIGYVETPFGNLAIFVNGSTEWRGR